MHRQHVVERCTVAEEIEKVSSTRESLIIYNHEYPNLMRLALLARPFQQQQQQKKNGRHSISPAVDAFGQFVLFKK